jgi:Flp pilus assembly protein protease CpaA
MLVDAILAAVLFIGLAIASWRDLQKREVPDLISLGLLAVGILAAIAAAIALHDPWRVAKSATGAAAGLVFGTLLYHLRQWGGGDAKLLAGVGAIIGLWAPDWRLLAFVVLLAFMGALYGVAWTALLIARSWKPFSAAFGKRLREPKAHRARILLVSVGALGIVAALFSPWEIQVIIGLVLVGAYLAMYGWLVTRTLEETALVKDYAVSRLTEGDWLVEDVRKGKRVVVRATKTGLSLEQIKALRQSGIKTVRVREGIPFVPAFLLAAIALFLLEHFTADILSVLLR